MTAHDRLSADRRVQGLGSLVRHKAQALEDAKQRTFVPDRSAVEEAARRAQEAALALKTRQANNRARLAQTETLDVAFAVNHPGGTELAGLRSREEALRRELAVLEEANAGAPPADITALIRATSARLAETLAARQTLATELRRTLDQLPAAQIDAVADTLSRAQLTTAALASSASLTHDVWQAAEARLAADAGAFDNTSLITRRQAELDDANAQLEAALRERASLCRGPSVTASARPPTMERPSSAEHRAHGRTARRRRAQPSPTVNVSRSVNVIAMPFS